MQSSAHTADRYLYFGFLTLLVWLPLPLGSNRPWAWSLMVTWVALLAMAWLWLYWQGRVGITPAFRRARFVVFLFLVWLLWLAMQLLPLPGSWLGLLSPGALAHWQAVSGADAPMTLDPFSSVSFLLQSLACFLVFCLALLLLHNTRRVRLLILVLVYCGAFQAAYGGLMVMSGLEWGFLLEKEHYRGTATGTFVNRNHLAGYLELCLALGIGLLLADLGEGRAVNWRQRFRDLFRTLLGAKFRLRVLLAVMVIGMVLTHSRMGNSAFFVSLVVAGLLWILATGHRPRGSALLLLGSLLLVDVLIVGNWFGLEKVAQRLERTSAAGETRDEVVRDTLVLLEDYAVTGAGGGSYYAVYPGYRQGDVNGFYDHAHNDYLELAADVGLVGVALLGAILVSSLLAALLALFRRRRPLLRGLGLGVSMGGMALLIHSLVDFNLQIPANAVLYVLVLALGWVALGYPARRAADGD